MRVDCRSNYFSCVDLLQGIQTGSTERAERRKEKRAFSEIRKNSTKKKKKKKKVCMH